MIDGLTTYYLFAVTADVTIQENNIEKANKGTLDTVLYMAPSTPSLARVRLLRTQTRLSITVLPSYRESKMRFFRSYCFLSIGNISLRVFRDTEGVQSLY